MKKHVILVLFMLSSFYIHAQFNSATCIYQVSSSVKPPFEGQKSTTLNFKGYLYKLGNRYIYFSKPLFLETYPEGKITSSDGGQIGYSVFCIDTMQHVIYVDLDSSIKRGRNGFAGLEKKDSGINRLFEIEPGLNEWKILPATKLVNGLTCQKATLAMRGEPTKPYMEIWFATDIPMPVGPWGTTDMPGLAVEGKFIGADLSFSLQSFTPNSSFDTAVFWPGYFNEPFGPARKIRKPKPVK